LGAGKSLMGQLLDNFGSDEEIDAADVEHLKDLASEAPVIRMVNLIMQRAVESRASDIHVEPFEQRLKVRFRVDGVLKEVEAPPVRSTAAVISRIKIMAKLNIAERRLPQDGRIKLQVVGKELDLRVSTVPTMYGESVVIRLLHKESIKFDFATLGFDGDVLQRFLEVLALPHGIILITGPTGSGKSTTLYTALHKINTPERKIITVEDPVEYQLEGVNQIQTKPQIGLTFASALRSIVRQDPDVIMIGEMRDLETARIAVQSALTGHLVLSTLHTNDAAGGVARLMDMGLEDYLITSTVNGILGQRLVRRLCPHCRETYPALQEMVYELKLDRFQPDGKVFLSRAVGCEQCDGLGYKGRLAIVEFLVMSDDLRRLVMTHAQARQIEELALKQGMRTMYEDGMRKAVAGLTTIEEVMRVTSDA
jgi:general secretion pathway protein E